MSVCAHGWILFFTEKAIEHYCYHSLGFHQTIKICFKSEVRNAQDYSGNRFFRPIYIYIRESGPPTDCLAGKTFEKSYIIFGGKYQIAETMYEIKHTSCKHACTNIIRY